MIGVEQEAPNTRAPLEHDTETVISPLAPQSSAGTQEPSSLNPLHFLDLTTDLLSRGYGVRFKASGESMHPAIRDGEVITVKPVSPGEVKWGDILLYHSERGLIAHRVKSVKRQGGKPMVLLLCGDGAATCDDPVSAECILGKAVSVERHGRTVPLTGLRAKMARVAWMFLSQVRRTVRTRILSVAPPSRRTPLQPPPS